MAPRLTKVRGTPRAPTTAKVGATSKAKAGVKKPAVRRSRAPKAKQAPARGASRKPAKTAGTPARRPAKPVARKAASNGVKRNGAHGRAKPVANGRRAGRGKDQVAATRLMRIRELDPMAACGPGTSVMQLFRVDDLPTDWASTHLVFFDRHGWYCEHGRECAAVAAVRKLKK